MNWKCMGWAGLVAALAGCATPSDSSRGGVGTGEPSVYVAHATDDIGKVGILSASLLAAVVASIILVPRNRHHRRAALPRRVNADVEGAAGVVEPPKDFRAKGD